jgi:outer membrane protein assembly factor BamA
LEASRRARDNYFGLGNESIYQKLLVTDLQPRYYQVMATRWTARGEVQRILVGGLRALAGFDAENWKYSAYPGVNQLALDSAANVDPTIGLATSDVAFRAGLLFDTRDDEVATNKGVLLQLTHAVASANVAGDVSYSRTTASAAGYVPLRENVTVAGRLVAQGMTGTPRLGSYYLVETADRPYDGLGGSMSQRALFENRYLGAQKIFLNTDIRYHVLNLPRTARGTLLVFCDMGRVFQNQSLQLTTAGLKVGGGGGVFLQVGRAGIVGVTAGYGPNGAVMDFSTRWTY